MVISPESIAIASVSWALMIIGGLVKVYFTKKLAEYQTIGIIIPHSSGKSTLLQSFKDTFGEIDTNTVLLDIEELVYKSTLFTDLEKTELELLLNTDSFLYEAKMMKYSKLIFEDATKLIKQSNKKKRIVVLASTKAIIKNLGIKTYYSFLPSPKLVKVLNEVETVSINFLKYTISKINQKYKSTITYNNAEELFELMVKKLNLQKN